MTVYLDHAATTPVSPAAAKAAMTAMTEVYGNPSSTHAQGRAAKKMLDTARGQVAKTLGAKPGEIFFTAGGTEADNWALVSAMQHGRRIGNHLVTTAVELLSSKSNEQNTQPSQNQNSFQGQRYQPQSGYNQQGFGGYAPIENDDPQLPF